MVLGVNVIRKISKKIRPDDRLGLTCSITISSCVWGRNINSNASIYAWGIAATTFHSTRNQSFKVPEPLRPCGNSSATQMPMMIFATLRLAVSKNQMTSRRMILRYLLMPVPSRRVESTSNSSLQSGDRTALIDVAV